MKQASLRKVIGIDTPGSFCTALSTNLIQKRIADSIWLEFSHRLNAPLKVEACTSIMECHETLNNYTLAIKQEARYKIKFLEISKPDLPGIWRLKKAVVYSSQFKKLEVEDLEKGTPCLLDLASEIILLHYLN